MKLPPKRRQGEGPTPPGGGKFRTQRGVTGSESRARSPAPQSSNQVPGRRASGGWQLLRRVGVGSREERWPSTPGPLLQPCACLAEEGRRGGGHSCGNLCSPCRSSGGSWHLGEGTGKVAGDIGS